MKIRTWSGITLQRSFRISNMSIIFSEDSSVMDVAIFYTCFGSHPNISVFDVFLLAAIPRQTTLRCKGRTVSRKTFRARHSRNIDSCWKQFGRSWDHHGGADTLFRRMRRRTHFHKFSIMDGTMRRNAAPLLFPRASGKAIVNKCIN